MRRNIRGNGIAVPDDPNVTFILGDSISTGHPEETVTTWGHQLRYESNPAAFVVVHGRAGSILGAPGDGNYLSEWGRLPRLLRNLAWAVAEGRNPIIMGMLGANDYARLIASYTTYFNDLMAILGAIRAACPSAIILWGDILARGDAGGFSQSTQFNAARNGFNALMAGARAAGYINDLVPMGTLPSIGTDSAPADPTLFDAVDQLHPTRPLGQSYLLASAKAARAPYLT